MIQLSIQMNYIYVRTILTKKKSISNRIRIFQTFMHLFPNIHVHYEYDGNGYVVLSRG
jgi:hypothetical protein